VDEPIGVDREEIVDGRLRRYYWLTPARQAASRRGGRLHAHATAALTRLNLAQGDGDMTGHENLERGYRRWLVWCPRAFRCENGQEILAVLMACAPEGQRLANPRT
jgi:hypothetical protein